MLASALACVRGRRHRGRRRPGAARAPRGSRCRSRCWSPLINPLVSREGLTVLVQGPAVPLLRDARHHARGGRVRRGGGTARAGRGARVRALLGGRRSGPRAAPAAPARARSALTASLATRLVPVLARDAERLREAYGLRAGPRSRTGAARLRRAGVLTRALAAGALERAVDLAASLEVRGYALGPRRVGPRAPRAVVARRRRLRARRGCCCVALPVGLRARRRAEGSTRTRCCARTAARAWRPFAVVLPALTLAPFALARRAARHGCGREAHVPDALRLERVQVPLSRSRRRRRSTRSPRAGRGRDGRARGCVRQRQVDAAARGLRARTALLRRRRRGTRHGLRTRHARRTGPRELADVASLVFQDPESQVVMNGVRAELELPLESRGAAAAARRARSRRRRSRSGSRSCWSARCARCRAASSSASRSRRRSSAARGCCCSTSPPRSSTRWPARSCSRSCGA